MNEKASDPIIRRAVPGEEAQIHSAHMRSIREICIKDHGEDEIKGWGNRPLVDRWIEAIKTDFVLVVEYKNEIHGVGHFRILDDKNERYGYIHAVYLTPEVTGRGLAKEIISRMLREATENKLQYIKLFSSITAHGFYKKHGFVDDGEVKKIEVGGYHVTCYPMIRDLKQ